LWDALAEKRANRPAAAEFGATEGRRAAATASTTAAAYRAVLLALLAAAVGAALVDVAITRVLSAVVPATLLIGFGLDWLMRLDTRYEIRESSSSSLVSSFSSYFSSVSHEYFAALRWPMGRQWFTTTRWAGCSTASQCSTSSGPAAK
jgi:hypothetical protein